MIIQGIRTSIAKSLNFCDFSGVEGTGTHVPASGSGHDVPVNVSSMGLISLLSMSVMK